MPSPFTSQPLRKTWRRQGHFAATSSARIRERVRLEGDRSRELTHEGVRDGGAGDELELGEEGEGGGLEEGEEEGGVREEGAVQLPQRQPQATRELPTLPNPAPPFIPHMPIPPLPNLICLHTRGFPRGALGIPLEDGELKGDVAPLQMGKKLE